MIATPSPKLSHAYSICGDQFKTATCQSPVGPFRSYHIVSPTSNCGSPTGRPETVPAPSELKLESQ